MNNNIFNILCELGISDKQSIVQFYPTVRDRKDVSVLKCQKSGVIFLSRSEHMEISHYTTKNNFNYFAAQDRKAATLKGIEDTQRRASQFKYAIAGKKWLDVGTGAGGILDALSPIAHQTVAVEPQEAVRKSLVEAGYEVYPSINKIPNHDFDVITLFHVFEHLTSPIETLATLKEKMSPNAKIIIEVPHAKDFLISFLDLDAFKSFTFWSEHLLLHTCDSLRLFLEKAGFQNIVVKNYQRYPLANHLHWLSQGKPGGHIIWDFLRSTDLDAAYENLLAKLDHTDTLIATATKLHHYNH